MEKKDTKEFAAPRPDQLTRSNSTLEEFRALPLTEKALTLAQTQSMLFSNLVVRTVSAFLRKPSV